MKKLLILSILFLSVSCGRDEKIKLIQGPRGPQGENGHSLVSEIVTVQQGLLCPAGGEGLDIYLDLDDSLSVSADDLFMSSMIACNGQNGLNGLDGQDGQDGLNGQTGEQGPQGLQGVAGPQGEQGLQGEPGPVGPQGPQGVAGIPGEAGPQGPAGTNVTIVSYTSGSCSQVSGTNYYVKTNGSNIAVYSASHCSSSSKVEELSEGESFWFSGTKLGVSFGNGVRVISFN